MKGEEAIVASVANHQHFMATSVGIIPYGRGRIVFSTLDMLDTLVSSEKVSHGPKLIITNYIK